LYPNPLGKSSSVSGFFPVARPRKFAAVYYLAYAKRRRKGADLGDDIVVELEYDPSRFFTCDIEIEEYVSGISDQAGKCIGSREAEKGDDDEREKFEGHTGVPSSQPLLSYLQLCSLYINCEYIIGDE